MSNSAKVIGIVSVLHQISTEFRKNGVISLCQLLTPRTHSVTYFNRDRRKSEDFSKWIANMNCVAVSLVNNSKTQLPNVGRMIKIFFLFSEHN